jgi:hypothetical protein
MDLSNLRWKYLLDQHDLVKKDISFMQFIKLHPELNITNVNHPVYPDKA